MEDTYRNTAALNEKLAGVALEAAGKSSEVSAKWTPDTIAKLTELSKAKTDYTNALTAYANAQADIAAENLVAFAELAKNVQFETVELLVAASKELSEDATANVKNATDDAVQAAKKRAKS